MNAIVHGARLAAARLGKRWGLVAALASLAFVAATAVAERSSDSHLAAERTLLGAVFGLALPLLAYFTVGRALGDSGITSGVAPLARHGASRRSALLGVGLVSTLSLALSAAVLALVGVVFSRGVDGPGLARDVLTSGWVGLVGGLSYSALFLLGSAVGASGWGRFGLLLADWMLGSGTTLAAAVWPRGHLRSLLGADPLLDMPPWSATLTLAGLATVYFGAAFWRTPR